MTRINSNIPALIAQANLGRAQQDLELRLERLSTGLRINRGADDPAGLIISERLRAEVAGVEQGIKNASRASSVIATTEAGLAEVSDLLNSIRALVVEAANTGAFSDEELEANQQQIDSAVETITRISNTASFGGLKLLDGSLDYSLSSLATSAVAKADILGASFIDQPSLQVNVEVLASAQTGALFIRGDYPSSPADNGTIQSSMTLRITGPDGVREVDFTSGMTLDEVAAGINSIASLTGVKASLLNPSDVASGLMFHTSNYGSDAVVSVERVDKPSDPGDDSFQTFKLLDENEVPSFPPFPWSSLIGSGDLITANQDKGRDVQALVNGSLATGDGLEVKTASPSLRAEILLTADKATRPSTSSSDSTTTFHVTGGGAQFQLGPEVSANQQENIGVRSVAASLLGGTLVDGELQFLSSLTTGKVNSLKSSADRSDFSSASDILEKAIDEIAVMRGRLGAFEKNTLQTNVRSLQAALENLSASDSEIRDADFARETSSLSRAQILVSSGTSVLALANQQSQSVLQLLG